MLDALHAAQIEVSPAEFWRSVVVLLTTSLMGTIGFITHSVFKQLDEMKTDLKEMASSLAKWNDNAQMTLFGIENRLTSIEARQPERRESPRL
jgi:hypothetical protein